jgi:post-segregation antitoxin (ccd killing protein)
MVVCMARANVYLPDDLHTRARAAGLNVSELTRRAVERELDRLDRRAAMRSFLDELEGETGVATPEETDEAKTWALQVVGLARRSARGDKPVRRSTNAT